jgi:hypothetical protein
MLDMVLQYPNTWEAEAGGSQMWSQHRLNLSHKKKKKSQAQNNAKLSLRTADTVIWRQPSLFKVEWT